MLSPMPRTISGVRRALSRERRGVERRIGLDDLRAFRVNRRTGERRRDRGDLALSTAIISGEIDEVAAVDEDMIVEISDLDDELFGGSTEPGDLTQIIELVADPSR